MSGKKVASKASKNGLLNKEAVKKTTKPHKDKQQPKTKHCVLWSEFKGTDVYGYKFASTKAAFLELRKSVLNTEMNIRGSKACYDGNKTYNEDLEKLCDGDGSDRKLLNDDISKLKNSIMVAAGVNRRLNDKISNSEIAFRVECRLNDDLKKSKKNLQKKSARVKLPIIKSSERQTLNANHHKPDSDGKQRSRFPPI